MVSGVTSGVTDRGVVNVCVRDSSSEEDWPNGPLGPAAEVVKFDKG